MIMGSLNIYREVQVTVMYSPGFECCTKSQNIKTTLLN